MYVNVYMYVYAYIGGFLCDYSIRVCFIVAAAVSVVSIFSCWLLLEESLLYHYHTSNPDLTQLEPTPTSTSSSSTSTAAATPRVLKEFDLSKANPFPALRVHFSNKRILQLSIPFILSTTALGLGYVFIIYMDYRYHSTSTAVGIFISFFGLVNAGVQGLFIPRIIPNIWNEQRATMYGLLITSLQTLSYGLCPVDWGLYILVVVFCLGTIYDPALKGLIVQESRVRVTRDSSSSSSSSSSIRSYHYHVTNNIGDQEDDDNDNDTQNEQHQGNLQGALSSIRTLATGVGALAFGLIFSYSVSDMKPSAPWLAFLIGALLYFMGWCYSWVLFSTSSSRTWDTTTSSGDGKNEALLGALEEDTAEDDKDIRSQ